MTEQEAQAIIKAIADGKPMIRWPEAERWEAICKIVLHIQNGLVAHSVADIHNRGETPRPAKLPL